MQLSISATQACASNTQRAFGIHLTWFPPSHFPCIQDRTESLHHKDAATVGGNGKYQMRENLTGSPSRTPAKTKPKTNKIQNKQKIKWGKNSWTKLKTKITQSLDKLWIADVGLTITAGHYQTLQNKAQGLSCAHHSYTSSPHKCFKKSDGYFKGWHWKHSF